MQKRVIPLFSGAIFQTTTTTTTGFFFLFFFFFFFSVIGDETQVYLSQEHMIMEFFSFVLSFLSLLAYLAGRRFIAYFSGDFSLSLLDRLDRLGFIFAKEIVRQVITK